MLFNSPEFIFLFLPAVLFGAFWLQRSGQSAALIRFLIVASLIFYGWWNWILVFLLVGSVVANFLFARQLENTRNKFLLIAFIGVNLSALGWFKYAHFIANNISATTGASIDVGDIALPLAISFFTFQQIAYLVDIYNGNPAERNFSRYALFVTFFPQLIAGPIVHHSEMLPQFRGPRFCINAENLSVGLAIFALGLFKKVVIADPIGDYSDLVFSSAELGTTITFVTAWFGVASFGVEIYFDFSAYSDMAFGLARMFGINLPINFNSPYKATSIIDFWRRWHITLSRFLRDYLYIPLGGRRAGAPRQYANILIVMLIGGLWHGAAWTFVLWGGLHGLFIVVNHIWRACRKTLLASIPSFDLAGAWFGRLLTLAAVLFAWTFFRAESPESAKVIAWGLLGLNGLFLPDSYQQLAGTFAPVLSSIGISFGVEPDAEAYPTLVNLLTVGGIFAATLILPNTYEWFARYNSFPNRARETLADLPAAVQWRPGRTAGLITAVLLLASLSTFLSADKDAFIYFQF